MNWDALGAIGELLGAIAVLVTLVYLAVQVKQTKVLLERNEKIALSQVHQARAELRHSTHIAQFSNPYYLKLSRIWGNPAAVDDLTPEELPYARSMMSAGVVIQDNALYQAELGLLDPETLDGATNVIVLNYDVWSKLEVPVTPRIERRYRSVMSAQQGSNT